MVIRDLAVSVVVLGGILFGVWCVGRVVEVPVVYMSYPDMECVTVQGGESDEDCDNMPPRFTVVYVDPKWAGFTEE